MSTTTRRHAPSRRRTTVHQRHLHPAIPPFLALLACLAAMGAALGGVFTVKSVEIVGPALPRGRMVALAGVSGANIFTVKSDQIVTRLSTMREVVVTGVQTSFPDRVVIHAQLRPSLVAWQTGTGLYVLDTDGRVIDRVAHTTLPIIMGTDREGGFGPGIVQAVRYAVQALPSAPKGAIGSFHYAADTGLTVEGRFGWHAVVGRGDPVELVRRVAELVAVLQRAPSFGESLVTLDLRYPKPVARFARP